MTRVVHALIALLVYRVWAYWLRRTEKIAANSTGELLVWGFRLLFKKKDKSMFSKSIALGSLGSLTVSESDGVARLSVSVGAVAGSGDVAGALKCVASVEADVAASELIDLGLALAEAKFPAIASLIADAKAGIDAELAKV